MVDDWIPLDLVHRERLAQAEEAASRANDVV